MHIIIIIYRYYNRWLRKLRNVILPDDTIFIFPEGKTLYSSISYLGAETMVHVVVSVDDGLDGLVWRHLAELVENLARRHPALRRVDDDETFRSFDQYRVGNRVADCHVDAIGHLHTIIHVCRAENIVTSLRAINAI